MRKKLTWSGRLQRAVVCLLLLALLLLPRPCSATPPPVITVQPLSQSVLILGSVTFTVTASSGTTMSYQWSKNSATIAGATLSSYTIATVQTTDAGTYSVKVTNAKGSVTSSGATLTVLAAPTIITQPLSQTATQGLSASLSVTVSGAAPLSYQWQLSGTSVAGATNAALVLTNLQTTDAGSYMVVVTNVWGSVTSAVAVLTVRVPPGITTQPLDQALVAGQTASFSVTASGTAPFGYQWSLNGTRLSGSSNSAMTIANIDATDAGSYMVVVTNAAGSVTSAVATLTVYVLAGILTQPSSQTTTQGQNAIFSIVTSGTAPLSYQWSSSGTTLAGATNAALTLTNVQTTDASSYTVVVTNAWGSVTSAVASLTVLVPAGIATQPQSQAVVVGQSATFSVAASGTTPLSYQWRFNGTAMSGATSPALTLSNVQSNQAGSYLVVVTNAAGSVTSAVAALTVYVPAGIATQPSSQTTTQGLNVAFSVVSVGTAPFSYQWSFNGAALSGASNASLVLTNVDPTDAGSYTVAVTNAWGSVTSAVATLTVLVPAGIATQPQSQAAVVGQSPTFSVTASGTAPFSYQWRFNGTASPGATSSAFTLSNIQSNKAGNYLVVVTNAAGSVTSAVAILTVYVPAGIATQPSSQTTTQGLNAAFSVVPSGTAPFSYQWCFNGTPLSGVTSSALALTKVQTTDAASYTVVVTNTWGSVTSTVATLTVLVPPGITTQPQSQAVVVGQSPTFSVTASGTAPFSYQWRFNGTASPGATSSALTLSNVQSNKAGSYMVVAANAAGSVTSAVATLTVYVPAGIATQPSSQTTTQGLNAAFSVVPSGTAPFSYQWRFNGTPLAGAANAALALTNVQTTDAGSYTVAVTNAWGSVTSAVATLTILVPPGITTQPQSQAVVVGQSPTFSVTASGTAPFSYQWRFNGTALFGATSSALTLSNVQSNKAGSYLVVVTNAAGSVTSTVATLTVYVPAAIATQPSSQTTTQGLNAAFSVVASGTAPFSYQWRLSGTPLAGATNSALALTNVQTADAGSYTVEVTNSWGSVTSAVATLTVLVPPGITTQPQSQAVVVGQSPTFTVTASGTALFSYQWRFNGTSLAGATKSAITLSNVQSNKAGSYLVVVTNAAGSVTSAVATLTVYVPPAITTQPLSQTVTQGLNATFSVMASGTAPFSYQWQFCGT
jgi:purine nucleoside phosphorylase